MGGAAATIFAPVAQKSYAGQQRPGGRAFSHESEAAIAAKASKRFRWAAFTRKIALRAGEQNIYKMSSGGP